ncbi:MAG: helix-turn-helix domain-containing protein [Steroidobacteraceae bacterium]
MAKQFEATDEVLTHRAAFGRRLSALRREAGLTQTALAAAAGMDRSFYVDVEHARHSVSVDRLFMIAKVLGVPAYRFFTED